MATQPVISQDKGSTGPAVTDWQNRLNSLGYSVPVTGVFDDATDAATRKFQTAKGLTPDGVVGEKTWGASEPSGSTAPAGPVATDIAAVPGLAEHTDNRFRWEVAKMATRLKTNPDYIVAAMAVETAKTFSPTAENPYSHAIGLIQFMPNGSASTLTGRPKGIGPGSGFEYLKGLSQLEQLVYVEKYFKPFTGKMNNPADAYLAVFYPSAMGKAPDHVIANEGTKVYEQNAGFDKAKKGYITAGDVGSAALGMLNAASKVARIAITPEDDGDSGGGGGAITTKGGLGLFAVTIAGVGLWLLYEGWKRW